MNRPGPGARPRRRHGAARVGSAGAALGLAALLALTAACGTTPAVDPLASGRSATPTPSPSETGPRDCEYVVTGDPARPVQPPSETGVPKAGTVTYVMKTNEGDVTLTLDRRRAPCTVHSFESLAAQKFFDQTRCPRLVNKGYFLLQCGDPTGTTTGGPGYVFADELTGRESYRAGVVAMANAGPNTNGSQFFLVFADTALAPNYTVFATMDAASIAVVKKIAADGSDPAGDGKPKNPATLVSVTKKS